MCTYVWVCVCAHVIVYVSACDEHAFVCVCGRMCMCVCVNVCILLQQSSIHSQPNPIPNCRIAHVQYRAYVDTAHTVTSNNLDMSPTGTHNNIHCIYSMYVCFFSYCVKQYVTSCESFTASTAVLYPLQLCLKTFQSSPPSLIGECTLTVDTSLSWPALCKDALICFLLNLSILRNC